MAGCTSSSRARPSLPTSCTFRFTELGAAGGGHIKGTFSGTMYDATLTQSIPQEKRSFDVILDGYNL